MSKMPESPNPLTGVFELETGPAMAGQTSRQSAPVGAQVWVHGQGLNTLALPTRAQRILGDGWEEGKVRGRITREARLGQVWVRLHTSEEVLVSRDWVEEVDLNNEIGTRGLQRETHSDYRGGERLLRRPPQAGGSGQS